MRRQLGAALSLAVVLAVGSAGIGGGERDCARRKNEGKVSILAWPGYAEDGSTDKAYDWVTPFEKQDRLQGDGEDLQHVRRGVPALRTPVSTTSSRHRVTQSLRSIVNGDAAPINLEGAEELRATSPTS